MHEEMEGYYSPAFFSFRTYKGKITENFTFIYRHLWYNSYQSFSKKYESTLILDTFFGFRALCTQRTGEIHRFFLYPPR